MMMLLATFADENNNVLLTESFWLKSIYSMLKDDHRTERFNSFFQNKLNFTFICKKSEIIMKTD